MLNLINSMDNAQKKVSKTLDFFVNHIFEMHYPQKLTKFRGKKIIPLYDWEDLYPKGVDRLFDFLPAEKTDMLPKFFCLSMRDEAKLKDWYRDYFAYVARIEIGKANSEGGSHQ